MTAICSRVYPPLRHLIETRMPKLDRALGPLGLNHVREVFNAMTGLDIMPSELVGQTTEHVYADLLEQDAAGTLMTEALPNGLWAIRKLKAPPAGANARVLVSRNRREGWYAGRWNGQHVRGAPPPPHKLGQMIAALREVFAAARTK
jgi:hypothetical protein